MIQKIFIPFLFLGASFVGQAQSINAIINTSKEAIKISLENITIGRDTVLIGSDSVLLGKDTIRIGSILIVNKKEPSNDGKFKTTIKISDTLNRIFNGDFKKTKIELSRGPKKLKNLETNWWSFDLGFANFNDYSPANAAGSQVSAESLSLNNKKSSNANLWFVQQKLNVYKHKLNLKYGIGVEMFNFRFDKSISFREDIPQYIKYDDIPFTKNKLLVKYLTIPVQINFKPNPTIKRGFYASVGMSAGYLLNAKNKQISAERGKEKFEGSFNLNDWRISTIGELGIASVRIYGSYGMTNLFNDNQNNYDIQPFAVGLRFSKF